MTLRQKLCLPLGILILLAVLNTLAAQAVYAPLNRIELETSISDVAWNHESVIAVGGTGVQLYDTRFQFLAEIPHKKWISSLTWSPDSKQLATSSGDQIEIWNWDADTSNLTLARTILTEEFHFNLKWSPDGNTLASAGVGIDYEAEYGLLNYGRVYVWDTDNWQSTLSPQYYTYDTYAHPQKNNLLDWNSDIDNPMLVSIGAEIGFKDNLPVYATKMLLFTLDPVTLERVQEIEIGSFAQSVAWQPGGYYVAVGFDTTVTIFDLDLEERHSVYSTWTDTITIDWSPDGTKFVAGSYMVDFEHDTEDTLLKYYYGEMRPVVSLWQENGNTILIVRLDGVITIEDPNLPRGYGSTNTPEFSEPTITATP